MPVHVPGLAVNVWFACGTPLMAGGAVFAGTIAEPEEVAAEIAVADPALLVAVTATRKVEPTSPGPTT